MGLMDKFLDKMALSDEEDNDWGYEPDFEEERPRKKRRSNDYQDDDLDLKPKANKITPMKPKKVGAGGLEVKVIKPSTVEDAREITDTLLLNRAVILNLEGIDVEIAQRIIDFTSGSCYAMNGNLQKVSNYIFIITPNGVDISGDFQEIIGAFDVPNL